MIDHVYISVTDIAKSLAFYRAALEPLGWREFGNYDAASGPESVPDLFGLGDAAYVSRTGVGSSIWLRRRQAGETGLYLGVVCDSNEAVERAYAAAISAGAVDEGGRRPGVLRPRLLRRQRGRLRRQPPRVRAQSLELRVNRLSAATSPYLLQHAGNPVDWQEWCDEAFAEARRRDVPVLLSVGYAACHWCHVMAHESFEDPAVAEVVNSRVVAIKVDREERPDIDAVYMSATQAMTGQGGWPMTVFMTPEGEPFYCGTYFPRAQFVQLVTAVAESWTKNKERIKSESERISAALAENASALSGLGGAAGELNLEEVTATAVAGLASGFDEAHGGFGGAPKFPPSMALEFLLRHHERTGGAAALSMAEATCEAMARGGIYDQLGGGFARYSVDASWTVPHFEKMLYDNALLAGVYTHLWRLTGSALARRVAEETCDFMVRELRTPEGGLSASLDADSDGAEGVYYVWTPAELRGGSRRR